MYASLAFPPSLVPSFRIHNSGLSPAVTEKAAQQFISHLRSMATSASQAATISEAFSASGFAALKQEAASGNSLIVVYLHSPLHRQATEMCQRLIQPAMLEFLQQDRLLALGASIHTVSLVHSLRQ